MRESTPEPGADREHCYALLLVAAGRPPGMSSEDVIKARLREGRWAIYDRTRYQQDMTPGRPVMLYAAGSGNAAQHVIGTALISSVVMSQVPDDDGDGPRVRMYLHLSRPRVFEHPVGLRQHRAKLSFIRLKGHFWYTSLQGGCARMTEDDWHVLLP
jgi:hypothetical protein